MSGLLLVLALVGSAPWWAPWSGRLGPVVGRGRVGRSAPGAWVDLTRGSGRRAWADLTPVSARAAGVDLTPGPVDGTRGPGAVGAGRRWDETRADPDAALLLELVAAALSAGAPVPRALSTIADALPGDVGTALRRVAGALALGSPWSVAWSGAPPAVLAIGDALEPTASTGASPVPLLRSAASAARRRRRAAGRAAAGRLGVWLVLPLGLCFLPAFLLLGVVPVVLSIAGRLLH